MTKGLAVWKDEKNNSITLDADNAFWAISKRQNDLIVPREVLSLYEKTKDKLDSELRNFRFSTELSAIYIDPTDRCNARCPYCYVPIKTRLYGRSVSDKELGFVLEKIKRYFKDKKRKPVIIFHASEPLLVKEIVFSAITKYQNLFKFGLQTNATLLKKEDVRFLKENRVGVGISLDSCLARVNNRLRPNSAGGGNFAKAVEAIECFGGYEGLNIITTVTKLNVRNLSSIVKFLHTKRVPCVLLNPVRLTQKNSRSLKPDVKLLTKHFIAAVDTAIELSKNTGRKIIVGNFSNVILAIVSPLARRLMCDISPCGGGRCFFTITAKGSMIPCGEFIGIKGFSGGNIFKDTIDTAMESAAFKKVRSRIVEKINECEVCIFRNLCGAPCPAELHSLRNMYKKSVFCEFYKAVINHAFSIIGEGKEKYLFREDAARNFKYQYRL